MSLFIGVALFVNVQKRQVAKIILFTILTVTVIFCTVCTFLKPTQLKKELDNGLIRELGTFLIHSQPLCDLLVCSR